MSVMGRQLYALVAKDFLLELRTKDALGATLLFALLVLVTFNFALDLRPEIMAVVGPGILWTAILFAGTIGFGRGFAGERDQGTLEFLLGTPVDRGALFAAKLVMSALVMALAEVVLVPVFIALFNVRVDLLPLLPVLFVGTIGLAAVGTLFSAMAAHTRSREVRLPVLLFPIAVPLLIGVVEATGLVLGTGFAADRPWLGLLVAFDAIYLALGLVVFEYVLEE